MKKYLFPLYAFIAGLLITTTSCEHKPLYILDDSLRNVNVRFDWKNLMPGDEVPEGMSIVFNGIDKKRFDVTPDHDMNTTLMPGEYSVISWENDNPSIDVNSDDPEKVIIWHLDPETNVPNIYVSDQKELVGLGAPEEVQQMVITPERLNTIFNIRVHDTDVVDGALTWKGSLSGLTNGVYLATGECAPGAEKQTMMFTLNDIGGFVSASDVSALGTFPGEKNYLILYIGCEGEKNVYYKFDVTNQIQSAKGEKNVPVDVYLKGASQADAGEVFDGVNGSMEPVVDPFDNNEREILM